MPHLLIIVITGIILLHIYLFVAIKLIVRQQMREEQEKKEVLVEKEQAAKAYALLTSQAQ